MSIKSFNKKSETGTWSYLNRIFREKGWKWLKTLTEQIDKTVE